LHALLFAGEGDYGWDTHTTSYPVIPAKAGIQGERRGLRPWIPAFAGMTAG